MKMSNNSANYEVLIKQYLRSILDISVQFDFLKDFFFSQLDKINISVKTICTPAI